MKSCKNILKICLGAVVIIGVSGLTSAGAFWPFSDSNTVTKEMCDTARAELESSKHSYTEALVATSDSAEKTENDLKKLRDAQNDLFLKFTSLNDSYNEWEKVGYRIESEEYKKFIGSRAEFNKSLDVFSQQKEILKNSFKQIFSYMNEDEKFCKKFKNSFSEAIESYYKYNLVTAKTWNEETQEN